MTEPRTIEKVTNTIAAAMHHGGRSKQSTVPEHIRRVVAMLQRNRGDFKPELRSRDRHVVVAPCRITFDAQGYGVLLAQDAYIHNISLNGAGLLALEPRGRDDLIEIKLDFTEKTMYVCGIVVHCRHIEGNVHEVGVRLHERSSAPVLATFAAAPGAEVPAWFAEARDTLREARGGKKLSA